MSLKNLITNKLLLVWLLVRMIQIFLLLDALIDLFDFLESMTLLFSKKNMMLMQN